MMRPRGLFVAYADHLGPGKGGVQKCTTEFLDVLRAAGLDLEILSVYPDRRITTRLGRRLNPSKYWRPVSSKDRDQVVQSIGKYEFLFLNQVALAGALNSLSIVNRSTKIILLSHGSEITDLVHLARLKENLPLNTRQLGYSRSMALGLTLADESKARERADGVICIAPYDADTERWLGTRQATWIPRVIHRAPRRRRPVAGRFGYLGTLDHAPNLEGLVAILKELKSVGADDLTVRIVGSPHRIGKWLEEMFPNAVYLGTLDDENLKQEAQTWEAFLNPIFCLARGCSTKLADPISWSMPIVTSSDGRRGYSWTKGELVEANDPTSFVAAMQKFKDLQFRQAAEQGVRDVGETSPGLSEIGSKVAQFLGELSTSVRP